MYRRIARIAAIILGSVAGLGLGVGSYTFVYAKGFSYLGNDPATCANCHIMQDHYDAWAKGSHHAVATCNDCHTPHSLIPKYYTKGVNGYHHSLAFTTGHFHEPIQITQFNRDIAEASCRYCHEDIVHQIDFGGGGGEPMECIRCHSAVGHLE
ncbi:MAG TPA: cytochrome c nitrite reductase small subunit [Candidatus Hydrogenedentes bacterium]|nr:cytochrome c nitrite reductase small subunit [Candidatus Hydrogenedentota bacterium]HQH52291.1 cytochrome c nitrite reductase small subunit [Candidatus Hydrogenedentota bacterium]HQM50388.1 cytochrome c nitrite reductase small subunit [Candidatus Hydrogenedentota bacterium]